MMRASRMFVAGLALVAVMLASRVSASDPKYLPDDTELLLTINVKQMLDSDLVKSQKDKLEQIKKLIQEKLPGDNQAQKYLEKAGFDPFKDFGSLTFAMPASKDPENIFVLVDGNFDAKKIEETAKAAAADHGDVIKINKLGKHLSFEISPPGDKRIYGVLLNSTTMAFCGSKQAMQGAIDRATGDKKGALKKEVSTLLQGTNNKQSLNFVATGSALTKLASEAPGGAGQQAADLLKQINGVSGAITITKDVQLQVNVAAQTAEKAKEYATQAEQGLKIVSFLISNKASQDEKFQPLADAAGTLRATANGEILTIRGELSFDNIQKLMKNFGN
jgi:hypothetical protein